MKKIKLIIALLAVAVGISAFSACGIPDVTVFSYSSINNDTEYEIHAVGYANGVAVIPVTYNKKPVTKIADSAFRDAWRFIAVTVPESIKTIGDKAFIHCWGLTVIMKSTTPPAIKSDTFTNTKCIVVPDSALEAYKTAWKKHEGKIYSDASVTDGKYLISDGTLVSYLSTAPDVVIPDTVTKIGDRVFYYNELITQITIPASVTEIAVSNLSSTEQEAEFVKSCIRLSKIKVNSSNTSYCDEGGVLYNIEKTKLLTVPEALGGNIVVPKGITQLSASGRFKNTAITGITLPEGYTRIISESFKNCHNLTQVTLPADLNYIGSNAFENCSSLKTITIPSGVSTIGYNAFSNCGLLTIRVKIPESEKPAGWANNWNSDRPVEWGV